MMRNPECGFYDKCLTVAARKDADLECIGCPYEKDTSGAGFTESDIAGCLALVNVLLRPERFKDYLEAGQLKPRRPDPPKMQMCELQ